VIAFVVGRTVVARVVVGLVVARVVVGLVVARGALKYHVLSCCFVGLRPVSYVPYISSTTGLFILDCPFDFSRTCISLLNALMCPEAVVVYFLI
jgi:hypothetical protein